MGVALSRGGAGLMKQVFPLLSPVHPDTVAAQGQERSLLRTDVTSEPRWKGAELAAWLHQPGIPVEGGCFSL